MREARRWSRIRAIRSYRPHARIEERREEAARPARPWEPDPGESVRCPREAPKARWLRLRGRAPRAPDSRRSRRRLFESVCFGRARGFRRQCRPPRRTRSLSCRGAAASRGARDKIRHGPVRDPAATAGQRFAIDFARDGNRLEVKNGGRGEKDVALGQQPRESRFIFARPEVTAHFLKTQPGILACDRSVDRSEQDRHAGAERAGSGQLEAHFSGRAVLDKANRIQARAHRSGRDQDVQADQSRADILYKILSDRINGTNLKPGQFRDISGDISVLTGIEMVDQNPIGRSSRSNPVTYLKAYDEIRKLYSELQASIQNNFKASHFSFNIEGGRCEECQGEGIIRVEMQFMADVELTCESCKGMRFKKDVLEVKYHGKNIYDMLEMTIDEALDFFNSHPGKNEKRIIEKLRPLSDVGLGYIKMGQSSSTLSGGESQRVKLAYFLSQERNSGHILFIFDEPTTGLHFHDINKLLKSINALVDHGHSVILIEHNQEVIKSCDWVIDLGPEGGENGGNIVFAGCPEELVECKESYTGRYLAPKLA